MPLTCLQPKRRFFHTRQLNCFAFCVALCPQHINVEFHLKIDVLLTSVNRVKKKMANTKQNMKDETSVLVFLLVKDSLTVLNMANSWSTKVARLATSASSPSLENSQLFTMSHKLFISE